MRQIIGALDKPDDSQEERVIELYMLYPVTAGNKNVYVVVDPEMPLLKQTRAITLFEYPKNLVRQIHSLT